MLTAIVNLFGRSPFAPLASHMNSVSECVFLIRDLFDAMKAGDRSKLQQICQKIQELEHQADRIKNDIRNHLPKSMFLAINREDLLQILTLQDRIADKAEDIAVITTLKELQMPATLQENFQEFLEKNLEAFEGAKRIIKELHELLESSFGEVEVEKVKQMVDAVALAENQADRIQHKLLKNLIELENEISYTTFFLWQRLFQELGAVANISEKLANRVRATLELK